MDPIVTNTPRAGESLEARLARTPEARQAYRENEPKDLDELLRGAFTTEGSLTSRLDPAPDPVEAARQRAADFVHNICTQAQLSLRERRDEIDNLVARMSTSERTLVSFIGEFAKFSAEVLTMSTSIKAEIEHATVPFKADPPATLTQPGADK